MKNASTLYILHIIIKYIKYNYMQYIQVLITRRSLVQILPPQPSFGVKIDAPRKTRDFLGFSSFFAVFLAFLKIEKYSEPKDANRVIGVVEGI